MATFSDDKEHGFSFKLDGHVDEELHREVRDSMQNGFSTRWLGSWTWSYDCAYDICTVNDGVTDSGNYYWAHVL